MKGVQCRLSSQLFPVPHPLGASTGGHWLDIHQPNECWCCHEKCDLLSSGGHILPYLSRSSVRETSSGRSWFGAMMSWLCSMRRSRSNSPYWIKARDSTTRGWRTWESSSLRSRSFVGKRSFLPRVWRMSVNSGNERHLWTEAQQSMGSVGNDLVFLLLIIEVFNKLYKIIFYVLKLLANNNNFSIFQNLHFALLCHKKWISSLSGGNKGVQKDFLKTLFWI